MITNVYDECGNRIETIIRGTDDIDLAFNVGDYLKRMDFEDRLHQTYLLPEKERLGVHGRISQEKLIPEIHSLKGF